MITSFLSDDDDNYVYAEEEVSIVAEDNFHIKVVLNVLGQWRNSFADDSLLRILLDRLPRHYNDNTGWVEGVKAREEAWLESVGDKAAYVNYAKIMSLDDIREIIIDPIIRAYPEVNDPFPISLTCRTLSDLLELNDAETLLLQSSIYSKALSFPWDYIYPRLVSTVDRKDRLFSAMFDQPHEVIKTVLEGFLIKSGFISPSVYPEGLYVISPIFENLFNDADIGPDDIEDIIFPNNLSTDLTHEDYAHIGRDVDRTEKIINNALARRAVGSNILLWGPAGTGKTELAIALAKKNGWNIKAIGDISDASVDEKSRTQRLGNLKIAQKLFTNDGKTVLLFDEIEDLFKADNNATFSKAFINRIIETTKVPIIWTTNSLLALGSPVLRRMTYNIHCTTPPKAARRRMWEKYAESFKVTLDNDTKHMLDSFDIAPALIRNSMLVTGSALATDELATQQDVRDIVSSLDRLVNYGEKRRFATAFANDARYDVTCVNTERDLEGFTNSLIGAKSPDYALCLYGPPGTGKSQYGRYLASRLGKEVLFRRASDLTSKWVGESEKLIAAAFEEAKEENKVLIIDEGDTFLRNRERAEHSWEVSAINEMLSQMEEHPEPFVMTTNLIGDLDPAAMRRFTFKMKFDFMTPAQAARLFRRYYAMEAPARIERNHILTPGDIACVAKQVRILGIRDAETIYGMIEAECAMKPDYSRAIGF